MYWPAEFSYSTTLRLWLILWIIFAATWLIECCVESHGPQRVKALAMVYFSSSVNAFCFCFLWTLHIFYSINTKFISGIKCNFQLLRLYMSCSACLFFLSSFTHSAAVSNGLIVRCSWPEKFQSLQFNFRWGRPLEWGLLCCGRLGFEQ